VTPNTHVFSWDTCYRVLLCSYNACAPMSDVPASPGSPEHRGRVRVSSYESSSVTSFGVRVTLCWGLQGLYFTCKAGVKLNPV
jgi:hypothetical protein